MDNFVINGVSIKNPTGFKIERYNITNLKRLSSGDMTGDLIAKKKKFYFTYAAITNRELQDILDAIWESDAIFFPLHYNYNGDMATCSVYVGSIPTELARAGRTDNWVWKNVTFNLIER